ncbi:MAG: hypothetical protein L0J08_12605, partial [Micrococcaceae bacterium]|nr:hypothetical protein [Micrococcaceae bacterium]
SASVMDKVSAAAGSVDQALPGWAWPALLGLVLLGWWILAVRRHLKAEDPGNGQDAEHDAGSQDAGSGQSGERATSGAGTEAP